MSIIHVLDDITINQIAAGEVIERPKAVVKELIENAVDAGASAITAEIKEGGLSLIRITDNGEGIAKEDIAMAFLSHATSKIRTAEDLLSVTSLGFRGEALSSVASVAQVEVITKTPISLNGFRYIIEGGEEKNMEEIGCPGGTTILVRNLFYNTPARRKFLKSAMTEAGYISDLMERLMVSHPDISFKYIVNNKVKLQSSGNNNTKDILYNIYGREIARELLPIKYQSEEVEITGYIGKSHISRGNRNFENYFINGRYIKSAILTKAIEEAYKPYMMQHKYPFVSLYFEIDPALIDVNVHPQKLEIRFKNNEEIFQIAFHAVCDTLSEKEMIPKVTLTEQNEDSNEVIKKKNILPEPFENNRRRQMAKAVPSIPEALLREETPYHPDIVSADGDNSSHLHINSELVSDSGITYANDLKLGLETPELQHKDIPVQLDLFNTEASETGAPFLSKEARAEHRIIGQLFSTFWLVEYKNELYIIDQHAAHEKVLYEKIMASAKEKTYESQILLPPIVLSLTLLEQQVFNKYKDTLCRIGYEFEHFGGNEYCVRAVPADLYGLSEKKLLLEFIDDLSQDTGNSQPDFTSILGKIASLSCKAAVKANHSFSTKEAYALIGELLMLENPYHCPHGRPVIISMSRYELEKKFKRIL
jgi:DNA mismatch repair protein MutL